MDIVILIARVLFANVFLASAMGHLTQTAAMTGYAEARGVPGARVGVLGGGVVLALGGVSVLLGLWGDVGALLLVTFLLPTALLMHAFWKEAEPGADERDGPVQQGHRPGRRRPGALRSVLRRRARAHADRTTPGAWLTMGSPPASMQRVLVTDHLAQWPGSVVVVHTSDERLRSRLLVAGMDDRAHPYVPTAGRKGSRFVSGVRNRDCAAGPIGLAVQRARGRGGIQMLLGMAMPYEARASVPTTCLLLGRDDFETLLADHPALSRRWLTSVSARLARSHTRLTTLLGQDLETQLARLLLDESHDDFVPFPQSTLAAMLGARRPSVNRVLRRFVRDGLVELRYRNVHIIDRDALQRLSTA